MPGVSRAICTKLAVAYLVSSLNFDRRHQSRFVPRLTLVSRATFSPADDPPPSRHQLPSFHHERLRHDFDALVTDLTNNNRAPNAWYPQPPALSRASVTDGLIANHPHTITQVPPYTFLFVFCKLLLPLTHVATAQDFTHTNKLGKLNAKAFNFYVPPFGF